MALTFLNAVECMAMGIGLAQELGVALAIAIVDEAGHLVACHGWLGTLGHTSL
jgi:uncharacterized protein GlcG (DUF336 family)